jgi:hypothetical protein
MVGLLARREGAGVVEKEEMEEEEAVRGIGWWGS